MEILKIIPTFVVPFCFVAHFYLVLLEVLDGLLMLLLLPVVLLLLEKMEEDDVPDEEVEDDGTDDGKVEKILCG